MEETKTGSKKVRLPNFIEALIPIVVMMGLMLLGYVGKTGYTDAHMPLVVSICVACIIGGLCGHSFSDMLAGMLDRLNATMEAILILCTVGILVASFIMSGTIPAVIYYGLDLLTPRLFLPVGCIMCAIVGLACGSSWTATATIGIAFLGIGAGLGINPAITAGMIISGAYLGDKFSPLSDTTNLAAAVAGTGLFDHVTAMVSTTAPTFVIALILYTILGININTAGYDPEVAAGLQTALASKFNINPLLLIPIIVVIAACVMKLPGLVGIAVSVFCGVLFAAIFQGMTGIGTIFNTLHYGITVETGNEIADKLLNRGGMDHQMWTINLILLAVAYGGALERCGCLAASRINCTRSVSWCLQPCSPRSSAMRPCATSSSASVFRHRSTATSTMRWDLRATCSREPSRTAAPSGRLCSRGRAAAHIRWACSVYTPSHTSRSLS